MSSNVAFRNTVNHSRSPTFAIGCQRLAATTFTSTQQLFLKESFIYGRAEVSLYVCVAAGAVLYLSTTTTAFALLVSTVSQVVKVSFSLLASETEWSTNNKSTLERACSTRFQPRSALFVYCNRFDNELKVRFRLILLRALLCDCSRLLCSRYTDVFTLVLVWYVMCTVCW